MKNYHSITRFIPPLILLIAFGHSHAKSTESISFPIRIDQLLDKLYQWRNHRFIGSQQNQLMRLESPVVFAGVLCFLAASISSAGGIGGGGIFIPILTIVAGVDLKTASTTLSAFMVTGGSAANVMCNLYYSSPNFGGKTLIDFEIALLSEPYMLLGVSIGVICNLVFPEWLITILFATFLAWSTSKTCQNGVFYWRMESEELMRRNGGGNLENGLAKENCDESEGIKTGKEPLLGVKGGCNLRFPWMKMGVLVLVWLSFFVLYLLRGNGHGQGIIIQVEPCGSGYWITSSLQIPLAMVFTSWILCKEENLKHQTSSNHEIRDGPSSKLIFPRMALLARILGGFFGIGGGMLISPLLLQAGIVPEVTAATCSFMVFFSSTMSVFQYISMGMEHTGTALIFATIWFAASLLGLVVMKRAIRQYGRASLVVFSVSTVMVLSTVLMIGFGALLMFGGPMILENTWDSNYPVKE